MGMYAISVLTAALWAQPGSASQPSEPLLRHVSADETWTIRSGRLFQDGRWVFLKTGKMLRAFDRIETADKVIADIKRMAENLDYNHFSLNIYPDAFDANADSRIDDNRRAAHQGIGRILDACWEMGLFCSLSFETYNVGGGGIPPAFFEHHPEAAARNGLDQPARDVEYFPDGKLIPSIYHPAYQKWSREFLRNFLKGLGQHRLNRLLYVETTVEPQFLGSCTIGDRDRRRAFLDFNEAAHAAFDRWQQALPGNDPGRQIKWPSNQHDRDAMLGHEQFNRFRAESLADWVNGDIEAIRSVAPNVYLAVDFNGREDDTDGLRLGNSELFLSSLHGVNVIQIAPHTPYPWGTFAWDLANKVNERESRQWAITEHMTATGDWEHDDAKMTRILDNTLVHGTRWGWEFVNAGNAHEKDSFNLYNSDWTGPTLEIIEGAHWAEWLRKIGTARFVPTPRGPDASIHQKVTTRSWGL